MKRRGKGEGHIEELPSGAFRAVVSKTIDGRRVKQSKTFAKRAEAVAWKNKTLETGPAQGGTFGDWLAVWLELHRAAASATNYRTDRQTVEKHLRGAFGEARLRDVSGLKIERWLAALKDRGVSQNERHKCGRTVRKILRAAVHHALLPGHVKFRVPKRPDSQTHSLTRDQLPILLGAAERKGYGAMFRLWADTGCRPGEVIGLKIGDYDPARGEVRFQRAVCKQTGELKELKTKRSKRTLPLAASTRAALDESLKAFPGQPSDPLFPAQSGRHHGYHNLLSTVFAKVRKASGLSLTPYTIRHTMASLLLQAGVSLKVVSERLGHEDVATTLRSYAHVLPGMQEAAAAKMGELLDGPGPMTVPRPT